MIAVLLVVLAPAVSVSFSATGWLAYVVFLIEALVLLLFVVCVVFKLAELLVRLLGKVPFDESRSSRAGGLFGALGRTDRRTPRHKRRKAGGRAHQNTAAQQARKRRLAELKQREGEQEHIRTMSDTTLGSQSRMLSNGARPGQAESFADSSIYSRHKPGHEEDFIMSPMHNGTWSSSGRNAPGFVKAGQYAAQGAHPVLRSGPSWGSQPTIVSAQEPAMPPTVAAAGGSSGFARVGGGRATSGDPYAVVKPANAGAVGQGTYPPYANARRMSQSAVIEMAGAAGVGAGGAEQGTAGLGRSAGNGTATKQRPPVLNLPSSSLLLSNQVSRYSSQPSPGGGPGAALDPPAQASGFFGRFRRRQPARQDTWSDEDDDSEEELDGLEGGRGEGGGRLRGWLPAGLVGGKRRRDSATPGAEEDDRGEGEAPTGETGFSVVRKPRPRPQGGARVQEAQSAVVEEAGTPTTPGGVAVEGDPLLGVGGRVGVPRVSVEAPSRPGTPVGRG